MILRTLLATTLIFSSLLPNANAAELKEATFDNGARLIVEEDHSAPVAMVQIWLKVGGRDEVPGKTGLAHVFEHMMFKGSKKLAAGEYSRRIAAMGGNDNAFTSHDYTAYFETVPASRVGEVIAMEAERFANLNLRDEDFQKEIRVIQEERRMRTEDDPNSHMFEELSAAALRLHPYRNPVIGWMQDLKRLTIDDVRDFYERHYIPGNAAVVVVGDVDFEQVKKRVGETFGSMQARPLLARFNPTEPEPFGPKRIEVTLPAQLPLLAISIPVPVWKPGESDRDTAALAVATEILAGGKSAKLTRELVDSQRVSFSASAGYDPFGMGLDLWYAYGVLDSKAGQQEEGQKPEEQGLVAEIKALFSAEEPTAAPEQTPEKFEAAFWSMMQAMRDTPPSDSELAAAKRRIVADDIFARDSLYLRAKHIGILETVGIGAAHQDEWLDAIRAVTAADVQRVIGQWIRPERATTGLLNPAKTAEVKS